MVDSIQKTKKSRGIFAWERVLNRQLDLAETSMLYIDRSRRYLEEYHMPTQAWIIDDFRHRRIEPMFAFLRNEVYSMHPITYFRLVTLLLKKNNARKAIIERAYRYSLTSDSHMVVLLLHAWLKIDDEIDTLLTIIFGL